MVEILFILSVLYFYLKIYIRNNVFDFVMYHFLLLISYNTDIFINYFMIEFYLLFYLSSICNIPAFAIYLISDILTSKINI